MSFTLWFTGISGAGKTTLSILAAKMIRDLGMPVEVLDGDTVRSSLDILQYGERDRRINLRMLGMMSLLLNNNGVVSVVAAISPLEEERARNRERIPNYVEVYCETTFSIACERDVKGLYKKAMRGEIGNFTGISSDYETPASPSLVLQTYRETVQESLNTLKGYLISQGFIPRCEFLVQDSLRAGGRMHCHDSRLA